MFCSHKKKVKITKSTNHWVYSNDFFITLIVSYSPPDVSHVSFTFRESGIFCNYCAGFLTLFYKYMDMWNIVYNEQKKIHNCAMVPRIKKWHVSKTNFNHPLFMSLKLVWLPKAFWRKILTQIVRIHKMLTSSKHNNLLLLQLIQIFGRILIFIIGVYSSSTNS